VCACPSLTLIVHSEFPERVFQIGEMFHVRYKKLQWLYCREGEREREKANKVEREECFNGKIGKEKCRSKGGIGFS
jgi:hypothetical protein